MVSSDSHIVKMWDQQTGVNFTNIEPSEGGLNDICLWKDSGLVMLACDAPKIQVSKCQQDSNPSSQTSLQGCCGTAPGPALN